MRCITAAPPKVAISRRFEWRSVACLMRKYPPRAITHSGLTVRDLEGCENSCNKNRKLALSRMSDCLGCRVGEEVAPHRAGFPHPVPHARDSLTMSWTTISAVLHTGTRCSGSLLGSAISSAIHAVSWTQVKGPESPQCFSTWFSPRGASLPSFGSQRAWFPALTGTMKALRLPTRASAVAYFIRFRRPRDPPALCSP
jgi:hypothetical protein